MTSILINMINVTRTNWLSAAAALAQLGVRPQTLYANVSRKRIRVRPDPDDPRRSLYNPEDVRRLALRHRGRPSHERVATEAVAWGDPVLSSGLSTVMYGRLWYRGQDAVGLAERASLEDVASILWQSEPIRLRGDRASAAAAATPGVSPLQAAYRVLAARAGRDAPMYGRTMALLRAEAVDLAGELGTAVILAIERARQRSREQARTGRRVGNDPPAPPLHVRLARAWRRPAAADLVRRALVLLADHELNASTFATRVAASTGAALSASILAGFATLSGPLHGGAAAALQALVGVAREQGAERAILAALSQGHPVPAFGHPLYPEGDVRALALLEELSLPPAFQELRAAADRLIGEPPNIDFALVALAASANLPAEAPFVLFALARSVGWIAHALEQRETGSLIRPRARYSGAAIPSPGLEAPA